MIFEEPVQTPSAPTDVERKEPQTAEVPEQPAPGGAGNGAASGGAFNSAAPQVAEPSPALARFHSCRWRSQPEDGVFCTHRDVLPMAGKTGFVAESWCPDCEYFKVRRAPRKREYPY